MKPNEGTFVNNALEHGVAGINIDESRVEVNKDVDKSQLRTMNRSQKEQKNGWGMNQSKKDKPQVVSPQGRFPANIIHDGSDEVVRLFPNSAGQKGSVNNLKKTKSSLNGIYGDMNEIVAFKKRNDSGSAARFFYCAKASRAERNAGCDNIKEIKRTPRGNNQEVRYCVDCELTDNQSNDHSKCSGQFEYKLSKPTTNNHPTVKPLSLMTYLTRLLKMSKDTLILDPFAGSGSTLIGCINNDIDFIGIELDKDYCEIAEERVKYWKILKK